VAIVHSLPIPAPAGPAAAVPMSGICHREADRKIVRV
jgi:hypothetical protein